MPPPFIWHLFLPMFFSHIFLMVNAENCIFDSETNPSRNAADSEAENIFAENKNDRELDARSAKIGKALNASLFNFLDGMPISDEGWCQRVVNNEMPFSELERLESWRFDEKPFADFLLKETVDVEEGKNSAEGQNSALPFVNARCNRLRRLFPFHEVPLSAEERQFPLAYGLLVHKSAFQVFSLISAIYQPQNVFCLIVDEKAEDLFKQQIQVLADCLPNIFIMGSVGKIEWCKFGVTRAVTACLRYLAQLQHPWEYFQYLSGVDLPLKTNLEMVRIFKSLKGSINMEIGRHDPKLMDERIISLKPPLTLWKSSLSALIPRDAANAIVASEKVRQHLRLLQHIECSDENIWASVAGNPKELRIPGGFDAAHFLAANERCKKNQSNKNVPQNLVGEDDANSNANANGTNYSFSPDNYYISRYQAWEGKDKCYGKFVKLSCVFGLRDIPLLVQRPELMAHKLYMDHSPAAYFCLWKTVHERALDWRNQRKFRADAYAKLPTVRAAQMTQNGTTQTDLFAHSCNLSF